MKILREWGYEASVVAEMAFDIPQMYAFHREKTKDVEVDLIRVDINASRGNLLDSLNQKVGSTEEVDEDDCSDTQ